MNILSIPMFMGGASHQIPMFMLHQKYFKNVKGVKEHFLLPKRVHNTFKKRGVNVLPINYEINISNPLALNDKLVMNFFEIEKQAYNLSNPDIIIEDCSFSSPLHAEANGIPRISIHRTGFFRSIADDKRNPNHRHSLEIQGKLGFLNSGNKIPDKHIKEKTPQELVQDYLHAKTKIIPGIPLIEKLPDDIVNKDSFFYSGPLNLEDNLSDSKLIDKIHSFIKINKNRKLAFITTGLINKKDMSEIINTLIKKEFAVISTTDFKVDLDYKNNFFYHHFLPLNFICSEVDLVIHHCGSGMYHYPLLNEKPVITLGTQSYDREDVALRLEELKLSKHVPASTDNPNYLNIFKSHLSDFENLKLCDFKMLKEVKKQIQNTMENFNPIDVIEYTLNKKLKIA